MIPVDVPGWKTLRLEHLVLDFNGTLARDGRLLDGVRETLEVLSTKLVIHVVTADTFGCAATALEGLPCTLTVLPPENQARQKLRYVEALSPEATVSVGNGRNDRFMVECAGLGIVVIGPEGASLECIQAADVVCGQTTDALGLLLNPLRLVATLRG